MQRPGRVNFAGVWFDNVTMDEAIARIDELIDRRTPSLVVTPNVDHLLRLQKDREYAEIVRSAALVLADGQPIVWASRLLGTPLKERVTGSDLLPKLCEHAAIGGHRLFFLGGDPGAATRARDVSRRRFPGLNVVGTHCPPYGFESRPSENHAALAAVQRARPDILCVGLGSPKQERWIVTHMKELQCPVSIGVGISFSFVAGQVKRAPKWIQAAGCEWVHRLCTDPRRLWKRYLVRGWAFLPILLRELAAAHAKRPIPPYRPGPV